MKTTIIVLAALALSGCGAVSRAGANLGGHSKVCVEGVSYLQFPSGAVVQVDRTGKPVPCQ